VNREPLDQVAQRLAGAAHVAQDVAELRGSGSGGAGDAGVLVRRVVEDDRPGARSRENRTAPVAQTRRSGRSKRPTAERRAAARGCSVRATLRWSLSSRHATHQERFPFGTFLSVLSFRKIPLFCVFCEKNFFCEKSTKKKKKKKKERHL
jgi:hypothetical protein